MSSHAQHPCVLMQVSAARQMRSRVRMLMITKLLSLQSPLTELVLDHCILLPTWRGERQWTAQWQLDECAAHITFDHHISGAGSWPWDGHAAHYAGRSVFS